MGTSCLYYVWAPENSKPIDSTGRAQLTASIKLRKRSRFADCLQSRHLCAAERWDAADGGSWLRPARSVAGPRAARRRWGIARHYTFPHAVRLRSLFPFSLTACGKLLTPQGPLLLTVTGETIGFSRI